MKADSKFLNKYKKEMTNIMLSLDPTLDKEFVEKTVLDMIKKNIQNPKVTLDNNFTGESRDTTLLSVIDWAFDRKPILCGNATFYKNQHESINPIAKMLEGFLNQRKLYKKCMFAVEDNTSAKYKDFERLQLNEKINANSYYGASGAPSSAFYSQWSGPATTHSAQEVISTAENLFEGFIADNYDFINLTELIEWIRKVLKSYHESYDELDDFIKLKNVYEVKERLLDKIIDKEDNDDEILERYLLSLKDDELSIIYYKNNLITFIEDHEEIQYLIFSIFENIENLDYADTQDDSWFGKVVPDKYRKDMYGKTSSDWNKFVNTQYFMDPNNVPDTIVDSLSNFKFYLMKYIYCRYLAVDRIYRLKNFKRRTVTVIDTDSNILSLDTIVNYIMNNVICGNEFGRPHQNNIFICINMLAYVLTSAVTDILLTFGEYSNVPEEYRPIYNMKNEFYFSKLIIGLAKKRYISKILLREGNLMKPPKQDIKGFDFKKATCSEYAEKFYMKLLKKYVIDCDSIDLRGMLKELKDFRNEIEQSIRNGERTYLPNGNAKEIVAYKNPEQEQSIRGVLAWNILNPDNMIELPSKVSLLKLNIFEEDDILPLKETHPDIYYTIKEKIFNDKTGMFVTKTFDPGVNIVNPKKKEWYNDIPKKYQAKYKKLGPNAWNEFAENFESDDPNDKAGQYIYKYRGLQVLAIPSNGTIPEWVQPYIDYATMINNIIAPFIPVLEIFKNKTVEEGKLKNGVNRKTNAFTNIVKF